LRKSLNEQRLKDQIAAKEAKIRSGKTTDEGERIAAEKTAALTNPTVARSEKPKSATVKPKSVRTEIADGNPVEATSQKEKDADFTARSSKTEFRQHLVSNR